MRAADHRAKGLEAHSQPYPTYKPSGVDWLGDVPAHWEVRRLCESTVECVNGVWGSDPNGIHDLPCVRVADFDRHRLRVRKPIPTMRAIKPSDRQKRILRSGDLLLEKSGGGDQQPVGVVILFDHDGSAVCSNFIGRITVRKGFDSIFLTFLHSTLYSIGLNTRSIKQTTGIQNLDSTAYLHEAVGFPPLAEQRAIAHYLDHVDARIRRYVTAREKLIALLEEERQAVIHRAVTRGLDPNVRLKPSGVDWLGDIPADWEVRRSRFLFKEVDIRSTTGQEAHLSMSQALGLVPSHLVEQSLVAASYVGGKLCKEGDLVLNRLKAHLGVFALAKQAGLISPDYSVFRKRGSARMEYYERVLRLSALRRELRIRAKGIVEGFWRLYTEDFFEIRLPAPPLHEQAAIVEYLDNATTAIDDAITRARRQIKLLHEYHTRLIADVVTGKLDVREAAAQLHGVQE